MREGFRELRSELGDLRSEISVVRGEGLLNRRWMMGMWVTMLLGFAGLIVETSLR